MEALKQDLDRPLSAILTLNTVSHTMGAAGSGAQYVKVYGNQGEAAFAALLTLAILILTEIIPKTLGAKYSEFFAKPTAHLLPILDKLLFPLVWFCGVITKLVTLGGTPGKTAHREALLATAAMGEEDGELYKEESTVVRNVLRLTEMQTEDIMTPRSVMFMLPETSTLDDFIKGISEKPYSRIPVYRENRDDITGIVLRSEALLAAVKEETWSLEGHRRPLIRVEANKPLDSLMRRFLQEGHHIALVTDSFGTVTGLVTLEDILETVVGVEIMDESDQVADLQELARRLWRERADKKGIDADKIVQAKPAKP